MIWFSFAGFILGRMGAYEMIWRWIWNTSEFLHIGLGRLAPIVFRKMIGRKGKRIR